MAKIATCCFTPLIWTFAFRGQEWFCRTCKETYPMMNAPVSEEATPELETQKKANTEWWREASKGLMPQVGRRKGCDKCGDGEYHSQHATDEETKNHQKAMNRIMEG